MSGLSPGVHRGPASAAEMPKSRSARQAVTFPAAGTGAGPGEQRSLPASGRVPWLLAQGILLESTQGKAAGFIPHIPPAQRSELTIPEPNSIGKQERGPSIAARSSSQTKPAAGTGALQFGVFLGGGFGVLALCQVPPEPLPWPPRWPGSQQPRSGSLRAPAQSPYLFPRRGGKKGGFVFFFLCSLQAAGSLFDTPALFVS